MSGKSVLDVAKSQIVAYNEKNWEAARAALAADVVYDEVASHRRVEGVEDVLASWRGWATALPDSRATIHNEMASGETAVIELTWHGTHTGPLQLPGNEVAATGRTVEMRGCQVIEVAGDKVRTVRHYFDITTMLRQLGIVS